MQEKFQKYTIYYHNIFFTKIQLKYIFYACCLQVLSNLPTNSHLQDKKKASNSSKTRTYN